MNERSGKSSACQDTRTIRQRRTGVFTTVILTVVGAVLISCVPYSHREFLATTWLFVGVVVAGVFMIRWLSSRCPRCGHLFYARNGFGNALSSKCLNCGLPLGGDDAERMCSVADTKRDSNESYEERAS